MQVVDIDAQLVHGPDDILPHMHATSDAPQGALVDAQDPSGEMTIDPHGQQFILDRLYGTVSEFRDQPVEAALDSHEMRMTQELVDREKFDARYCMSCVNTGGVVMMLPSNITSHIGDTKRPYLVVADSGCAPHSVWMDLSV